MKIQCQSCQAKYTIADEKVLGKVVKIRCKKCSATIVINGNETRPAEDNADTHVFDYAGANEQWTVNVADGDQRTMTPQEIAAEYKNGLVNDETFCWKDGMADWLPLREIELLHGLVKLGPSQPMAQSFDEISVPPQSIPQPMPLFAAAGETVAADASPFAGAHANGNGALFGGGGAIDPVAAAAPAAARRGGGRGQGADLFGNVATAGGEDDVMTSAAAGAAAAPAASTEDQKLTGQRNENSVLFSLSALTSSANEESSGKESASSDGSGLIDIRALSASIGTEDKKKEGGGTSRVDDIMNLSGGGAFGAALAAPILAPLPLESIDLGLAAGDNPAKSAKTMMIGIIGAGALVAIAIIVGVVLVTKSGGPAASPSAALAPTGPNPTDMATTAAPTAPTASVADNTPPPPGTGHATGTPGAKLATGGRSGTGGAIAVAGRKDDAPAAVAAVPEPPKPAGPTDLAGALAQAAGKKDDTPKDTGGGGATAPFDRGAATASLGGIVNNLGSCKKPDGPTGAGHAKVTFSPNGTVSSAVIDSGPFPGTPVGGCIAGKFRGAHVPPFSGGPVTVGKSFTIN